MTELAQRSKSETALATIRSDTFRQQLEAALPAGITADRFARVTATALLDDESRQRDPAKRLTAADPASLYQAVIKCAQDGLLPDGREAALVKRGQSVSYMPMIGGFRKIAAEHGWTIRTHAVFSNDEFDFTVEPPSITHKPGKVGEARGDVVAAYAIATHRNGQRQQVVIPKEELAKRRKMATTQDVWEKWEPQQAEKTAGRDIFAELSLDPMDRERIVRVLEASALEPGGAAEMLYGPNGERMTARSEFGEQPSGVVDVVPEEDSPELPAGDATDSESPDPSGGSAGEEVGAEDQSVESSSSQGANGESVPVSEPSEDQIAESIDASLFVPPSGRFAEGGEDGPMSLGEILLMGDEGRKYLGMCLRQLGEGDWRTKTDRFCLVEMPAEYAAAMAKRAEA